MLQNTLTSFIHYYSNIYGKQKFQQEILPALLLPNVHCAMINPFLPQATMRLESRLKDIDTELALEKTDGDKTNQRKLLNRLPWLSIDARVGDERVQGVGVDVANADILAKDNSEDDKNISRELSTSTKRISLPSPTPMPGTYILPYYLLDAASLCAAEALGIQADSSVLDMCAAPGGKSLAIMFHMYRMGCLSQQNAQEFRVAGKVTANEMSLARRQRLAAVFRQYLPPAILQNITITQFDATKPQSFLKNSYDRVLCDAPCSSERHVLHSEEDLIKWTPSKTRSMSQRQILLLQNAISACRSGGRIVYATCSISPTENDMVIESILAKYSAKSKSSNSPSSAISVIPPGNLPIGSATKYGWFILPSDAGNTNWGPLYFAVLGKA